MSKGGSIWFAAIKNDEVVVGQCLSVENIVCKTDNLELKKTKQLSIIRGLCSTSTQVLIALFSGLME